MEKKFFISDDNFFHGKYRLGGAGGFLQNIVCQLQHFRFRSVTPENIFFAIPGQPELQTVYGAVAPQRHEKITGKNINASVEEDVEEKSPAFQRASHKVAVAFYLIFPAGWEECRHGNVAVVDRREAILPKTFIYRLNGLLFLGRGGYIAFFNFICQQATAEYSDQKSKDEDTIFYETALKKIYFAEAQNGENTKEKMRCRKTNGMYKGNVGCVPVYYANCERQQNQEQKQTEYAQRSSLLYVPRHNAAEKKLFAAVEEIQFFHDSFRCSL